MWNLLKGILQIKNQIIIKEEWLQVRDAFSSSDANERHYMLLYRVQITAEMDQFNNNYEYLKKTSTWKRWFLSY